MSEFFFSRRTDMDKVIVSVFHAPETDKGGLVIPERIMRAQGKIGIDGLMGKWQKAILEDQPIDATELSEGIEEISADQAVKHVVRFLEAHEATAPFECSVMLPEQIREAFQEHANGSGDPFIRQLGTALPQQTTSHTLYTGQYL